MHCPILDELPPPPAGKTGWPWTEASKGLPDKMPNGNPWPKLSIVTPSYNQSKFIEETIRSVLLQGYPNLEYIIMDGASTDGSADIIRKYEPWLSYWVSEPDKGQSNAINKGFQQSTGTILAWINSDDTYEKDALSSVVTFMEKNPLDDVVYGNAFIVNEEGYELAQMRTIPFNPKAFIHNTVHIPVQSAVFWRREIFLKAGGIDEDLRYAMDVDLLVKFIEAGANFGFLREFLGTYRCHGESKTFSDRLDKPEDESLKIEAIAKVRTKPKYKFRRFLYRLRQMFFLTIQGDLPYILSRILARIKKQKSYEEARDGYKN